MSDTSRIDLPRLLRTSLEKSQPTPPGLARFKVWADCQPRACDYVLSRPGDVEGVKAFFQARHGQERLEGQAVFVKELTN